MPRTLHIAMASDADFTIPLCLAMHSMVQTANPGTHYRFHLLDNGINRKLVARGDFDCVFYDVRGRLAGLPCGGRFPASAYHRYLIPELLPADIDRVLYLDCDIMVREDLCALYDMPLGDRPIAAVPWLVLGGYREEYGKTLQSFPQRMGVEDDGTPYFYSSMLLVNLQQMRREGMAKKLIECTASSPESALCWPDQDVINAVFRHRIASLPLRYNVIPLFLPTIADESQEAREAFLHPAIVHFAARKPNILIGPRDDMEHAFFRLWRQSPWKRCIPYPLVSLRELPPWIASLLRLPMRLCIRHPKLLHAYGALLNTLRKRCL